MTRLVAGSAGGRTLVVPRSGATRPTSERVREALFSRLEHEGLLDGTRVLDLYAGSGALGLEAASRGAAAVVLVDAGREAARACRQNVETTGLPGVDVREAPVERVLAAEPGPPLEQGADLVLVDPPYDVPEDALGAVLAALVERRWLAADAVVVVERAKRSPEPTWPDGLSRYASRKYGDTVVWFAEYGA
ncbi:16S rRNA (guanine(966)-N(2))-methyltransferase RsmD [uncultured Pseudokineococcus sp.]|uniref:16S rRNA (guanine(966)-N(2))-methyltransferase RsmD n=1 Tax=uncultured Pseudokineococcus sp. TaxID=1642928 RepID=UPI0026395530|nr:16S rRNA (guanine(966)-N(2))-methyltransferase RsmD [uncultured Pseudokineococcus sp.]